MTPEKALSIMENVTEWKGDKKMRVALRIEDD